MKYLFLSLVLLGLMIPLACTNVAPTSGAGSRALYPTATPPSFQPTPAFIATVSTGISAPNGIAYASSSIYVAEGDGASVSQVQVLNATTNAVNGTWTGSGSTLFQFPNGVAVNAAGTTVYVLDLNPNSGAGTVYAMAPAATATPITYWNSYNGTNLYYPGGIAVDSTGNVYVADTYNGQLEEFGPSGAPVAAWSGNGSVAPMAVALDASNNVYVADGNNAEVWVLNPSGSTFTVAADWYLPTNLSYDYGNISYYGITVDSAKNVYVADYYNSQVEVYTNTGTWFGLFNGDQTGATSLGGPDGLLLYNNDIYVADYDSNNGSSAGILEIFGPNTY